LFFKVATWHRFTVVLLAGICLQGCAVLPNVKKNPENASEAVLLLPGLARTPRSMKKLRTRLEREGYGVEVLDYPSTEKTVEALSTEHLAPALERWRESGADQIHFVAHSLGAIVLRYYLAQHPLPEQGRIVMLGPPNRGSEVVDRLGGWAPFEWVNGPAGLQLGTSSNALPNTLPDPGGEVAVIAGTNSINWFLSTMIPGVDDGKVSVERTRLPNMADFTTVPVSHPFLMSDREVIDMVVRFLETGSLETE
jgi:pimeloyl-ACP methyl ester carboxylesterase